ncbi:MAG TPA: PAS domain S-box protein [Ignavibacteria bacterium]|nr:PAS domain S-box protein [Ignavibacteria bacterium]HMQ99519.1 PAS domain S-box protein [Ignavibacteria bacterium]
MNNTNKFLNTDPFRHLLKISLIYFFVSTAWIVVSDLINAAYQHYGYEHYLIEISKGMLFVTVTSALIFFLLKKYFFALHKNSHALIERESEYRSLTERLSVGIIRGTPDGKYMLMNNAARNILKDYLKIKPGEDIAGLRPEDIYSDQELVERVKKTINFISETGEGIVKKAAYGDRYLQVHSYPELNDKGEFVSLLSILTDETEITRSLHKLEESEKFNSHLVNSSHVVVYIYDLKKRRQVYANKALERILGYRLEEFNDPGISIIEDLMHPEDAQRMFEYLQSQVMHLKDGEAAEFEYRMKHKLGHYCWFKSHDCIFKRDESGLPLEILGSAIDITDLKKTQDELKQKTDYLKTVIEASPMGIFDLDTEGRIISIWNKASEDMFGWSAAETLGKILPVVPPEKMHELQENIRLNQEKKFIEGKELTRRKKSGEDINIKIYSRPVINKDGKVEAILAYNEDVTLKKQYDEEIKRNNEYLKVLYNAGIEANSTLDLQELYNKNFTLLQKIVAADCIILTSISEDRKFINCEGLQIKGDRLDPDSFPVIKFDETSGGPQTHAIKTGRPFIVHDYEDWMNRSKTLMYLDTDGVQHSPEERSSMDYQPPRSAIIIPLKYDERVYGVLQLQSFRKGVFSDSDLHKLEPFAVLFALAMQRAMLNRKIQLEFAEKEAAFEQVRKFSKGIEQSPNSIVITNSNYEIEYVNPYFTELTGYNADEVIGKNPGILKSGQTKKEIYEKLWSTLDAGEVWHGEFLNMKKNGELYWESASIGPITDENGTVTHYIAIKQDITEKKKKDKELKDSLEEKEVMLKEIHHRVKNNLQVISSLLNMQVEQYRHPEAIEAINSSRNRVKAMALVHENLYQSSSIGKTSLKEYMFMLAKNIYSSYGVTFERVKFTCETYGIEFGLDTIIPIGLILNEGISNSLKHGFPGNAAGEIKVTLQYCDGGDHDISGNDKPNTCYRLTIKDNGKGLPENFDPGKTNSLGMTLLTSLAAQLDGEAVINNKVGTEIVIIFRELRYKSRV